MLFEPNLRILTQEEHLRKMWELFCPLENKTLLEKGFWDRSVHQMTYIDSSHNPSLSVISVGRVTPYKIIRERYLLRNCVDARWGRCSCWWGRFGQSIMHSTVHSQVREKTRGREEFFMFKFFLSCYKIWIFISQGSITGVED